jgi:predicted deacetylase
VSRDEARDRLDRGEQVLREAGLRIDGYVAPAWSMPEWLVPMLATRGYRYTEDHTRVYDPAGGTSRASVVLNWASRSPGRLLSTVAWCRIAKVGRIAFPARVAIHPADMRYALLRHEVDQTLRWARTDTVARGTDLLA